MVVDLIILKFNNILNISLLKFDLKATESSMSIKLELILNHKLTRLSKGLHCLWRGQVDPIELD